MGIPKDQIPLAMDNQRKRTFVMGSDAAKDNIGISGTMAGSEKRFCTLQLVITPKGNYSISIFSVVQEKCFRKNAISTTPFSRTLCSFRKRFLFVLF